MPDVPSPSNVLNRLKSSIDGSKIVATLWSGHYCRHLASNNRTFMARLLKRALRHVVSDFIASNELDSCLILPDRVRLGCNIWMLLLSSPVFNLTGVHGVLCAIQGAIGWRARLERLFRFIVRVCLCDRFNQASTWLCYDYYVVLKKEVRGNFQFCSNWFFPPNRSVRVLIGCVPLSFLLSVF